MSACNGARVVLNSQLALSGRPIRLKIESFKPANVDEIKNQWDDIDESLHAATRLFEEWGFSGNNRANNPNAVIALAIFIQRRINLKESKQELRLFVIKSLIFELYRQTGKSEKALGLIRDYVQKHLSDGAVFTQNTLKQRL